MKIYVAFRTDVDPPEKMASGSMTNLRQQMKGLEDRHGKALKGLAVVGAEFTVVLYNFKPNAENLCQAIVDVTEIDAESAVYFRVNEHHQLREVK